MQLRPEEAQLIFWIIIFLGFSTCSMGQGSKIETSTTEIIASYEDCPIFVNTGSGEAHYSEDGYYYGKKWQCVEFVRRYLKDRHQHRMERKSGHAKDYFDLSVPHANINRERGLYQFYNTNDQPPKNGDIIVFSPIPGNPYGHIGIITEVTDNSIFIIQQNTKEVITELGLSTYKNIFTITDKSVLGWMRLP